MVESIWDLEILVKHEAKFKVQNNFVPTRFWSGFTQQFSLPFCWMASHASKRIIEMSFTYFNYTLSHSSHLVSSWWYVLLMDTLSRDQLSRKIHGKVLLVLSSSNSNHVKGI